MRHLALLAIATATTVALWAATLKPGAWSGTITPPSGQTADVTYTVGEAGGETTINLSMGEASFDFRNVSVAADHFTFEWNPGGTELKCRLDLQDDASYKGTCADAAGGTGHLVMVPPK